MDKLLTILKGMYHPHLIIEGKSSNGSNDQAIDQARRGGATLVNADRLIARLLRHDWDHPDRPFLPDSQTPDTVESQAPLQAAPSSQPQTPQKQQPAHTIVSGEADTHTFVFSMIVHPIAISFYVHWHERVTLADGSTDEVYHMNHLFAQANDSPGALRETRRVAHNIMKWGGGPRLDEHLAYWAKMPAYSIDYLRREKSQAGPKKRKMPDAGQDAAQALVSSTDASVVAEGLDLEGDNAT